MKRRDRRLRVARGVCASGKEGVGDVAIEFELVLQ